MGCGGSKGPSEEQLVELRAEALVAAKKAIVEEAAAEGVIASLARAEAVLTQAVQKAKGKDVLTAEGKTPNDAQKRLGAIDAAVLALRTSLKVEAKKTGPTKEETALQQQVAALKGQVAELQKASEARRFLPPRLRTLRP